MHFARMRNMALVALAWALFLLAYDQHANPRPLATYWAEFVGGSTRPNVTDHANTPRLRLSMPHLCCTGCLGEVRSALAPLTWLAPARLTTQPPPIETAEGESSDVSTAHEIEFDVLDLARADFVELDRALRESGLVADRVEVFGIGHFRLEVDLPHICCSLCSRAVRSREDVPGILLRPASRRSSSLYVRPVRALLLPSLAGLATNSGHILS